MDFDLSITARASNDMLEVTVTQGSVSWTHYTLVANGIHLTTLSTSTSEGQTSYFYGMTFEPGDNIEVKVEKIPSNKVVMIKTVMAL